MSKTTWGGFQSPDLEPDFIAEEKRAAEEEGRRFKEREEKARVCPKCGRDCGEPEFEPDDPSVGIMRSAHFNVCPDHGEFMVLDDGEVRVDDPS